MVAPPMLTLPKPPTDPVLILTVAVAMLAFQTRHMLSSYSSALVIVAPH